MSYQRQPSAEVENCPECGHYPAHVGRCWAWIARFERCSCTTRRNADGDVDGTGAAVAPAAGDGGVRPGSGDDAATVAASAKGLKTLLGGALKRDSGLGGTR